MNLSSVFKSLHADKENDYSGSYCHPPDHDAEHDSGPSHPYPALLLASRCTDADDVDYARLGMMFDSSESRDDRDTFVEEGERCFDIPKTRILALHPCSLETFRGQSVQHLGADDHADESDEDEDDDLPAWLLLRNRRRHESESILRPPSKARSEFLPESQGCFHGRNEWFESRDLSEEDGQVREY